MSLKKGDFPDPVVGFFHHQCYSIGRGLLAATFSHLTNLAGPEYRDYEVRMMGFIGFLYKIPLTLVFQLPCEEVFGGPNTS